MRPIRGAITALITPFRNGQVDFHALEKLVAEQLEAGIDGLVPCGTTGESPTLTAAEHRDVVRCVAAAAGGRVPVIAGAGSNSTAHAIELSESALAAGATALLQVNPYYNKPTQAGLVEHFSALARAVKAPIVLYNIPGRCAVELSVETIRRLYEEHDNIVAVKHATGRVDDAAALLQECDIDVLSGDDPLTWPLMSLGAVGVISVLSNLAPRAVKRLTDAGLSGDLAAGRAAHRKMFPLARALLSLETNPIPIKTALALRGRCAAEFRLPLCALSAENAAGLERILREHPLD